MSEPTSSDVKQALEAVYRYGAAKLAAGQSTDEVKSALVEKGLEPEVAATIVTEIAEVHRKAKKEAGKRNMMWGAGIAVLGIIVTAATYSAASGGGSYVVAWGAIVFGGFRFFRGLAATSD